ncbi:hypothetical protein ES705_10445 [subsurface metagenome]
MVKISTFSNILLFLVLFPYLSLIQTPFDTQPSAVIFSILIFSIFLIKKDNNLSFPFPLWALFLIFLYALGIYFINSNYYYGMRSLVGYASVFFITFASYKTFKYSNIKIYIFSINIWLLFGVVQLLFNKNFGRWFVPRMSTSATRRVTSLAVEPSYYATFCIFALILNELFYRNAKYNRKVYYIIMCILVFQMIITFSGSGFLFLLVFFFSKCISSIFFDQGIKRYKILFSSTIILFLIIFLFLYLPALQYSRAGLLLKNALKDPIALLLTDTSVADRVSHVLLSFYSLLYSKGIGLGLGTWGDYADLLTTFTGGRIEEIANVRLSTGGRIMSGWGSTIYEIGIFGVLFIIVFLWIMFVGLRRNKEMKSIYFISMLTMGFVMLMAVPIAFPLFGYTLGAFLYYAYRSKGQEFQKE